MEVRVLLADDHDVVREGIRRVLERDDDISVVGEAYDVPSAWKQYSILKPDVLVMDMSMPGSAGVDGISHVLQRDQDAKIVTFTIHENPQLVERVIEAGALGFVSKSCASSELLKAVKLVNKRKPYVSSDIAQTMVFKQKVGKDSGISGLSAREFNIFCLLAEGRNVSEISERLFLAEKTIANYVSQLKNKLEVKNTAEIVHLALQHRLITVDGIDGD